MDTPRAPEGMSAVQGSVGGSTTSSSSSASSSSSSSSSASSSSSYTPAASRPDEGRKDKQEGPEAEYLSSRCVLFTYYQGDISSVVDEHFSRALSSYMDGEGKRRVSEQQAAGTPGMVVICYVWITHYSQKKKRCVKFQNELQMHLAIYGRAERYVNNLRSQFMI